MNTATIVQELRNHCNVRRDDGMFSKERDSVERGDFWTTTSNKQLDFVQHVKTLA